MVRSTPTSPHTGVEFDITVAPVGAPGGESWSARERDQTQQEFCDARMAAAPLLAQERADAARPALREQAERLYPRNEIPSEPLVAPLAEQQQRRFTILRRLGLNPPLHIWNGGRHRDNFSYCRQATDHGVRIGVPVEKHYFTSAEPVDFDSPMTAAEKDMNQAINDFKWQANRARDLGVPPDNNALYLAPLETREGSQTIGVTIRGERLDPGNLDGIGYSMEEGGLPANTSEAMVLYVESVLGCRLEDINPGQICIVGMGQIGKGVAEILRRRGIEPGIVLANTEDVLNATALLKDLPVRVMFCAARGKGIIKPRTVTPPTLDGHGLDGMTVAIDAGNARDEVTGEWGGNIDATTLPGSYLFASPYIGGLGPFTAARLFERFADKLEREVGAWQLTKAKVINQLGEWAARFKLKRAPTPATVGSLAIGNATPAAAPGRVKVPA